MPPAGSWLEICSRSTSVILSQYRIPKQQLTRRACLVASFADGRTLEDPRENQRHDPRQDPRQGGPTSEFTIGATTVLYDRDPQQGSTTVIHDNDRDPQQGSTAGSSSGSTTGSTIGSATGSTAGFTTVIHDKDPRQDPRQ